MALLSSGGTFMVERCGRASTRPVASSVGTSSMSATGLARASICASASSPESRPLFMKPSLQPEVSEDEGANCGVVVQVQARQRCLDARIGGNGDDVRIFGMQERLAG